MKAVLLVACVPSIYMPLDIIETFLFNLSQVRIALRLAFLLIREDQEVR